MKIRLDDVRVPPSGYEDVKTPLEFEKIVSKCIRDGIQIEEISFDHDLWYKLVWVEITGYDCLSWFLSVLPINEKGFKVPFIKFHTANPVWLANMKRLLNMFLSSIRNG